MPSTGMKYPGSQSLSGQTGAMIVVRVRSLLNESTASFWSDVQILEWINNACLNIVSRTWCLGTTENISIVPGTLEYSLNTNYLTVITGHVYKDSTPKKALLKGHPMMFGHTPDVGEPVYWYEFDGKVGLYPLLSIAQTGVWQAKMMLVTPPAVITLGDSLPVPQYFDEAVVRYACAMGLYRDNELNTAQATFKEYETMVEAFSNDLLNKPANDINDPKAK